MVRLRSPISVLRRRLPRDLRAKRGRYALLAALIILGVLASTGTSTAGQSVLSSIKDGQSAANVEDGYIATSGALDAALVSAIEDKGVTLEDETYADVEGPDASILRVFAVRSRIDLVNLDTGDLPQSDDEAVVEKHYATAHGIGVGDFIEAGGRRLRVIGIGSSPDYTTVVARSTDTAADPRAFGTAFVTSGAMEAWPAPGPTRVPGYAVDLGDSGMSVEEAAAAIATAGEPSSLGVLSVLDAADNSRIIAGEDDVTVTAQASYVAGAVAILLIAYLLAVAVAEDIRQESPVIGTFYALGLTPWELMRHYLALPVALTALCAAVGTGAGIVLSPCMDSNSGYYSLPEVHTEVTGAAVIFGFGVPVLIVSAVGLLVLQRRLAKEPLQLLRRDLGVGSRPGMRLTRFPFSVRYRIRQGLREWRTCAVMLAGVVLSVLPMVFSLGMRASVDAYAEQVREKVPFDYLYVLAAGGKGTQPPPVPQDAERASVRSVTLEPPGSDTDADAILLGLEDSGRYFAQDLDLTEGRVYISSSTALHEGLKENDTLTLRGASGEEHSVVVSGIVEYPQPAVLARLDTANGLVGEEPTATNAVMTDTQSPELDAASSQVVSRADMMTSVNTLTDAMTTTMTILLTASISMAVLVIVLLMRMVVDKETYSISLMKALGYTDREVGGMYLSSYALVVAAALIVGIPLSFLVMQPVWLRMISGLPTAFEFTLPKTAVVMIVGVVLGCYVVARLLGERRLRRVDVTEVLKDRE